MKDMKDWIHEDQLPTDLSNDDYDDWFAQSRVIDGVRMGPRFPLPPIEAEQRACKYCKALVWVQSDNPNAVCEDCEALEDDFLRVSFDQEDSYIDLTETHQ